MSYREALGRLSRCDAGANGRPPSFGYRVNLNLSAKVLDFVKSGGAKLTGPLLDEATLSDFLGDMPSVPS